MSGGSASRVVATVGPASRIGGEASLPGDKSISHRALMFGALAAGVSEITNLAPGEDVRSTAAVLRKLGVAIGHGEVAVVSGRGFEGLDAPDGPLDCGNSGTTLRLMMGILAGRPFKSRLIGDQSLSRRPMGRIAAPLAPMGARFELAEGGRPPVDVRGGPLVGVSYDSPVASAQVKSAVILAGLQARGETRHTEPSLSRDHTERMLSTMGAAIRRDGLTISVTRAPVLSPLGRFAVPGDLSSAAFLMAAGLLLEGDGLRLHGVGVNPTRTGFLDAVRSMGASVEVDPAATTGEPTATLTVRRASLSPLQLSGELLVRAIDEVPILAVLATQAAGRSVIRDASELRVKESDRLETTARFLSDMGAAVVERPDGLIIDGPTPLRGAEIHADGDHRIAMAGAIAGLIAGTPTVIIGAESARVSYPGFFDDLARLTDAAVKVT